VKTKGAAVASKSAKNRVTIAAKAAPQPVAKPAPTLAGWLFPAYLAVIFIGYIFLRMPGAMTVGQEMGPVRALFSAVNAGTLTGFPQITDIDKYATAGQIVMFGMIVCGSVFSLIIGGCAVARILRLGYSDKQIALAAIVAEASAIVVGGFFLLFDRDRTFAQAGFMAASAFGNSGLLLGPAPNPWQTHLIMLPLIAAGGLGLCVLMELYDYARRRTFSLSKQANAALGMTAWIYLCGTAALIIVGTWAGTYFDSSTTPQAWRDLVTTSAAAGVASRTGGMGLVALEHLGRPAVWLVMLLMFIGGASGSTAGGVKTTTLVELYRGARRALAGEICGRGFGIALSWLGGFILLELLALLLLLHQLPQAPADHVLFLVISAASNVGLNYAPLNPDPIVAYLLCATMLIGRFAPLMVLWAMADTTTDAELAVG
jgi:Trk-type K+ transport system membrane component